MDSRTIAILVPGFRLFGQERALVNLGLTLRDAGYNIVYLIHAKWGMEFVSRELTQLGFRWEPLPLGTIWSPRLLARNPKMAFGNLTALLKTTSRLKELILHLQMDCLIVGNISFAYYLVRGLRKSCVRVLFRHGDEPMSSTVLDRYLSRTVFSQVDAHVANCRFVANSLNSFDSQAVASVIYNYPVSQRDASGWAYHGRGSDKPRLVYVGQLSPHKGVDLLLQAFDGLAGEHVALELDLVGAPPGIGSPEEHPLLRRVAALAAKWPGRVRYFGQVDDPREIYRSGAIHLCPSIWDDPSPNTIFEAKLHGLPTVAFARGGIPELIDHKRDGYLCCSETPEGLMEGIRYFLQDPEQLARARKAAQESLSYQFGREIYRTKWISILDSLLGPCGQSRGA